jgi:hypothetical protein
MSQKIPESFRRITELGLLEEQFRTILAAGDPDLVREYLEAHGVDDLTDQQIDELIHFDFAPLQQLVDEFGGPPVVN